MEIAVNIGNFSIKAKTSGNTHGEPILAIHGWLDNANTFDKIVPLFPSNAYIVAVDIAGHGLSDHRPENTGYYLWDYAVDLLQFVKEMGWKKFSIIAHSMGTGIASIMASALPKAIKKLIFLDGLGAPFVVEENQIASNFKKSIQQLEMAKKSKLFGFSDSYLPQFTTKEKAINDRVNNIIGPISKEAAAILTERSLKKIDGGFRYTYDPRVVLPECFKLTEHQARKFLESMDLPTLIILGEQGLFNSEQGKERLQFFKNAKVHWLPGGHHLHLEESYYQISILTKQFLEIN